MYIFYPTEKETYSYTMYLSLNNELQIPIFKTLVWSGQLVRIHILQDTEGVLYFWATLDASNGSFALNLEMKYYNKLTQGLQSFVFNHLDWKGCSQTEIEISWSTRTQKRNTLIFVLIYCLQMTQLRKLIDITITTSNEIDLHDINWY